MIYSFDSVEILIDGKPLPVGSFAKIDYAPKRTSDVKLFVGGSYEATVEMSVPRGWFDNLVSEFARHRQLLQRLRRRVSYGGRKGRRAARRLREMGYYVS